MVRFDARTLTGALYALLTSCGKGSHQPEPPVAVPSPAVQPAPTAPDLKIPKAAPKDTGSSAYPWQSGPIADL